MKIGEPNIYTRLAMSCFFALLSILCLYLGIATTVYRFRHPEKTETQRLQEIPKALMFK